MMERESERKGEASEEGSVNIWARDRWVVGGVCLKSGEWTA